MIGPRSIPEKCRIFRLRQFQGQHYLIGRMSALEISPLASVAWLSFDGRRSLAEIAVRLALETNRSEHELENELVSMCRLLSEKGAIRALDVPPSAIDRGVLSVKEARIPKALLWGGYNN